MRRKDSLLWKQPQVYQALFVGPYALLSEQHNFLETVSIHHQEEQL